MDRYDKVLTECRQAGIRTATYFSNKELHPSTPEFKEHGEEWGRKDRRGDLRHTFFSKARSEFGALMCLRSGWLEYLKLSIDRVLKNHPLDGVYFDWNVALYCENPLHEGKGAGEKAARPLGHGRAAGPDGVDAAAGGPGRTRDRPQHHRPDVRHREFRRSRRRHRVGLSEMDRPGAGAREPAFRVEPGRGPVRAASSATAASTRRRRGGCYRLFALEALLGGVAPWPASPETFELLPLLKPLGDIESYRFADWRNGAVSLSDPGCGSAVYSRTGEAYLLLANLDQASREVTCRLRPEMLPYPLKALSGAEIATDSSTPKTGSEKRAAKALDATALTGVGVKVTIPGDGAVLVRVQIAPEAPLYGFEA